MSLEVCTLVMVEPPTDALDMIIVDGTARAETAALAVEKMKILRDAGEVPKLRFIVICDPPTVDVACPMYVADVKGGKTFEAPRKPAREIRPLVGTLGAPPLTIPAPR
jgi:hypothetical protein